MPRLHVGKQNYHGDTEFTEFLSYFSVSSVST
jgi:hypothetical protein